MNVPDPDTAQGWIDLAADVVKRARAAAGAGDRGPIERSSDECAEFVSIRTPACPKAIIEAVSDVQVELSQLLISNDIKSITGRTAQFDAYLQDIKRLSTEAKRAADLISFKTASDVVDNLTGVIKGARALKKSLNNGDTAAVKSGLDDLVTKVQQIMDDFDALSN